MKPILAIYGIPDRFEHPYPAYIHDHNLTLLCDGNIEFHLHLERYTRRKSDNRLPLFIEELLDNIPGLKEFDLIGVNSFVGNAFLSKTGRIRIEPQAPPVVSNRAQKAIGWVQQKPWEGYAPDSAILSHELAHIFSCLPFFGSFRENSLLIHFDGGASEGNFSAFHFIDGKLKHLEHHWELSHLSKLYNDNALSFALMKTQPGEHCSVPGKLMGYAAMGNADLKLEKWLVQNNYFKDIWEDPSPFYQAAQQLGWNGSLENNHDPFLMDVAASMQSLFQKNILRKIYALQKQTASDFLYYTGGCALNIGTNSALVNAGIFKEVFIPPACNDSGLSLGAAAYLNWQKGKSISLHSPYLNGFAATKTVAYDGATIKKVAQEIIAGKIIGICNAYGPAGPRALGNRSIVCRPDQVGLAQKVSRHCKRREWFRPVAPVMLERNAKRVSGLTKINHLATYMLLDFKILAAYQVPLAGVIHTNGTARIQSIAHQSENPFLFDLLEYLDQHHQLLGLINTSFNGPGEPIVQSADDALRAATKLQLDGLIINGKYQSL